MSILVYAEHDNNSLKSETLNAITAAQSLNKPITVLVAGFEAQQVAEQAAKITGVSEVVLAESVHYKNQLAENVARLVADVAPSYTHVIAPSTAICRSVLPHAAALLDINMVSEVTAIKSDDVFERGMYTSSIVATVQNNEAIKLLTVITAGFDFAEIGDTSAPINVIDTDFNAQTSTFVSEELAQSDRPALAAARIVVSGGRGVKSKENFELIYQTADKLGAAVGASLPAIDEGFAPRELQVGQTGTTVAPVLYIACGISGTTQHLAGMKGSKCIVAINTDDEAPIAKVADYFLEQDLVDALPELIKKL